MYALTYFTLSWSQCHFRWLVQKCSGIDIVSEAKRYLTSHWSGITDNNGLHILRVSPLSVFVSGFATMEGAKLIPLFLHYVTLVNDFVAPNSFLTVGENNPTKNEDKI